MIVRISPQFQMLEERPARAELTRTWGSDRAPEAYQGEGAGS